MTDMEHLIDIDLLQAFGEETVVPLCRAIISLTETMVALNNRIVEIENNGTASADVETRLDRAERNILALALAFSIEDGSAVTGTADNISVELFTDTSGYILISGMFDSTNHWIYA